MNPSNVYKKLVEIAVTHLNTTEEAKLLCYIWHLIGFMANSVTASCNSEYVETVLSDLPTSLIEYAMQKADTDIMTSYVILLHNGIKRVKDLNKIRQALLAKVEAIFEMIDSQEVSCEALDEWFTILMVGLLNQICILFDTFTNKPKFLALYKNCVDEEIKDDKALLSASTLQAILDLAKSHFQTFMS